MPGEGCIMTDTEGAGVVHPQEAAVRQISVPTLYA